jgi:hypothetical protein
VFDFDHHAQAEMEFGGADPALADDKVLHINNGPKFPARL